MLEVAEPRRDRPGRRLVGKRHPRRAAVRIEPDRGKKPRFAAQCFDQGARHDMGMGIDDHQNSPLLAPSADPIMRMVAGRPPDLRACLTCG